MRRRLIILALLAIALAAAVIIVLPSDEPAYRGRKLSHWLATFDPVGSDREPEEFEEVYTALQTIGTNAVPTLLKWCDYELPDRRLYLYENLAYHLRKIGIRWTPKSPAGLRRAAATMEAFHILGPKAQCAIPELESRLKQNRASIMARNALASIGTYEARLVLLINAPDIQTRADTVLQIKEWDGNALPAIPALRQVMTSALNWEVRQAASNGLWKIENMKKR